MQVRKSILAADSLFPSKIKIPDPDPEHGRMPIPQLSELVEMLQKVHIVVDAGSSGKTALFSAMKYERGSNLLVLTQMPEMATYKREIARIKADGVWIGGTIIIRAPGICDADVRVLEEIAKDSDCRGLWVFSTRIPEHLRQGHMHPDWKYSRIESNWKEGVLSNLIPIDLGK